MPTVPHISPPDEPASPTCYARQADDAYMGYLDRDELVETLNVLLEAERAGVRVGARLVQMADDPPSTALTRTIRRDEAHWCDVLTRALRRLDATPSGKVGDFYGKAMAIKGFEARLAFVNRGQGWVVRKLKEILPKVRDDRLHADLKAMLDAHVANIEAAEHALERRAARPAR